VLVGVRYFDCGVGWCVCAFVGEVSCVCVRFGVGVDVVVLVGC